MRIQNFWSASGCRVRLLLAAMASVTLFPAVAQDAKITLSASRLTTEQVFDAIHAQTSYKITANMSRLGSGRMVKIEYSPVEVSYVLDRLLEGSGYTWSVNGNQIILPVAASNKTEKQAAPAVQSARKAVQPVAVRQPVQQPVRPVAEPKPVEVIVDEEPLAEAPAEPEQPSYAGKNYLPEPVDEMDVAEAMEALKNVRHRAVGNDPAKALEELQKAQQQIERKMQELRQPTPSAKLPKGPVFALKTNLLYDATTTFNLGAEFRLSKRLTLDVPVDFNPWTFSRNKKWKHVMVQPELRYWIYEPFNGHFVGPNLMWSIYNVGGVGIPAGMRDALGYGDLKNYRYEGNLYGIGASYGYHWMLSNRISLEATVGFGYAYMDYTKYRCEDCGRRIDRETKHYFGLTKLGLSLVFMIK